MKALLFLFLACSARAQVLLEEAKLAPCASGEGWSRSFELGQACTATLSIAGLQGMTREYQGEARLWLDNGLLTPLRAELSQGWRSPALDLAAGKHTLSVECGDEAFVIQELRLGTPESSSARRPKAAPVPSSGCLEVPLGGKAVKLSAPHTSVRSGILGRLQPSQRGRLWYKIEGSHQAVLLSLAQDGEDWILGFSLDPSQRQGAQPLGYKPGAWTELKLEYCSQGSLGLDSNRGEVRGEFKVQGVLPLRIESREIELEIRGRSSLE